MGSYPYPYPSLDWSYQGVDFYGINNMSQNIADNMYADGIRFVGRYLYHDHYPYGKGITRQEADLYLNAGLKLFFYYEVNPTDALSGYNGGYQAGLNCLQEAQTVGVPNLTQIYCCCDMDVTDAQANGVVMDYLNGFKTALPNYSCGLYGGANVMQAVYDNYPNAYRCQAGAWGINEFSPINIRQWFMANLRRAQADGKIRIANIQVDQNGYATWRGYPVDILSAGSTAGMWNGETPVPPTPPSKSDKMPIWFYLKPF